MTQTAHPWLEESRQRAKFSGVYGYLPELANYEPP